MLTAGLMQKIYYESATNKEEFMANVKPWNQHMQDAAEDLKKQIKKATDKK